MNADAFQTLSVALVGGTFLTVIARRFALPTIVLLFAGGILLGPQLLGWIQPDSLATVLPALVSIAIGIILFEGGLTLDPRDYVRSPAIIKRLLTVGALITWLGATLAVKVSLEASWAISLLAGSLVIVTGPTVIIPMLRRLRLVPRVASILHWEAVLIDALGVFLAVFCYELVVQGGVAQALYGFGHRLLIGGLVGVAGGLLLQSALRRAIIPENLTNPFVLASAVAVFALAEHWAHEAGLLSVTLAGVIVGRRRSAEVRQISTFKAELSDLLIGALFLLLVSRLDPQVFQQDASGLAMAVALLVFVVRPLNIWTSALGTDISVREKLFLSWVAPRGIVAASMASLFSLQLQGDSRFVDGAALLESFTYAVICATVILQGLTAGKLSLWLRVAPVEARGWLIAGAHRLARELARTLQHLGAEVLLVDHDPRQVAIAKAEGVPVVEADARDLEAITEDAHVAQLGRFLALTENQGLNELLATLWKSHFGRDRSFAWSMDRGAGAEGSPFEGLPHPAVLAEELREGSAWLETLEVGEVADGHALFVRHNGSLLPARQRGDLGGSLPRIFVIRRGGYLPRALEQGCEINLRVGTLHQLYEELLNAALTREPRLPRGRILRDLTTQEQVLPPFLGHGLAAPHAYSARLSRRLCVLAHLDPPLAVPGIGPIHTVYFILSPAGDPEGHLATLAEIARQHRNDLHQT